MKSEEGSDISGPYGTLVSNRWGLAEVLRLPGFLREVHRRGKHWELVSFVVWELMHRSGLFGRDEYIAISGEPVATINDGRLEALDLEGPATEATSLAAVRTAHAWKAIYIDDQGRFWGSLSDDDCTLYVSCDGGTAVSLVYRFTGEIKNIFISSLRTIFVCVMGGIYRSLDGGGSFKRSLNLASEASFCLFNNGMTETPAHVLIVGEYGTLWKNQRWTSLANVYYSRDEGTSWKTCDFLIRRGINKHVHLVKYSRVLDRIVLTDGDNQKNAWLSNVTDLHEEPERWQRINRLHVQIGGYTSMVELDGQVFLGTDYLGGTNFLVQTRDGKAWRRRVVPDAYRRNPIMNMVERRSKTGIEIWALLHSSMSSKTRCLLMYSADGGESWRRFIEYDGTVCELRLISSSREPQSSIYFSITNSAVANGRSVTYQVEDA